METMLTTAASVSPGLIYTAYGLLCIAIAIFVFVGLDLFGKGWSSYESRYVEGAEASLDSMYMTMPAQHVLYLSAAFAVVFGGLAVLFSGGNLLVGAPFALMAFSFPQLMLSFLKRRRFQVFGTQLVDALDTMSNALKAGLSLPQAFDLIHSEMDNPIRQEFRLLTHEMKFGVRVEDALDNLRERMPNPDLELITTAITVAQEVGGNLSDVFSNIANTIRERQKVEDKIKALTSQGKMQGIVLCLLPFAIGGFLMVINPAMMRPFFDSPIGWVMMGLMGVMVSLGGFFVKKIITIDV